MKLPSKTLLAGAIASVFLSFSGPRAEAYVVTYIDLFDTTQVVSAFKSSTTNTITSANSIGGFRTVTLTASGGSPLFGQTFFGVDDSSSQAILTTPANQTPFFSMIWGGAGGTAGLGGIDLTGGAPYIDLDDSVVQFSLLSADIASSYTWSFTDTSSNVATYTGSLPPHSSANPAINYAVSLSSFTGSGTIDWSSINFISLSGGGPVSLDLSFGSPMTVNVVVPEPGTWAAAGLLLLSALYVRWRRSRSLAAQAEGAVAAA